MLQNFLNTFFITSILWIGICHKLHAMTVMHYDAGYSPGLQPYMLDVLQYALDTTKDKYGPYKLELRSEVLSTTRSKIETEKGEYLNVLFSADWKGDILDSSKVVAHPFPAFNDLLGLRALLMTKPQLLNAPIKGPNAFQALSAGQGFYWADSRTLRHGGITVVEAQTFNALFSMLSKGRFDYLPLSIVEVQPALDAKHRQYPSIQIQQHNNIFYPIDFKLYVNAKQKALVERISLGFERASEQDFLTIFNKHFDVDQVLLGKHKRQLYLIENPTLAPAMNRTITQRFLKNYGQYFEVIRPPAHTP